MGSQGSSIGSSSQLRLPPRPFSWGQFSPGMSISIMSISVVFLSSLGDGTIISPDSRCQYFSGLPTLSQTCSSVIRLCHVYLRSASAAAPAPFSLLPLIRLRLLSETAYKNQESGRQCLSARPGQSRLVSAARGSPGWCLLPGAVPVGVCCPGQPRLVSAVRGSPGWCLLSGAVPVGVCCPGQFHYCFLSLPLSEVPQVGEQTTGSPSSRTNRP